MESHKIHVPNHQPVGFFNGLLMHLVDHPQLEQPGSPGRPAEQLWRKGLVHTVHTSHPEIIGDL